MSVQEVRKTLIARMVRYGFTPEMCEGRSAQEMLNILEMLVGHRQYLGVLDPTEILGITELEQQVQDLRKIN